MAEPGGLDLLPWPATQRPTVGYSYFWRVRVSSGTTKLRRSLLRWIHPSILCAKTLWGSLVAIDGTEIRMSRSDLLEDDTGS